MKNFSNLIDSPSGLNWYTSAGSWADEKILPFEHTKFMDFVIEEHLFKNPLIHPIDIVGTAHTRYCQGMTWREFLALGNRISQRLFEYDRHPQYYDNPHSIENTKHQLPSDVRWSLSRLNGKLFIDEANHRSVISKFRAHEEGILEQQVTHLTEYTVSYDLMAKYDQLQKYYLPWEGDGGPIRVESVVSDHLRKYQIFVRCNVRGLSEIQTFTIPEALEFVSKRNWFWLKVLKLFSAKPK